MVPPSSCRSRPSGLISSPAIRAFVARHRRFRVGAFACHRRVPADPLRARVAQGSAPNLPEQVCEIGLIWRQDEGRLRREAEPERIARHALLRADHREPGSVTLPVPTSAVVGRINACGGVEVTEIDVMMDLIGCQAFSDFPATGRYRPTSGIPEIAPAVWRIVFDLRAVAIVMTHTRIVCKICFNLCPVWMPFSYKTWPSR